MAGGTREVQIVPTISLDRLLEEFAAPDFLKIDVEGAEVGVLRGARTLLSEHRPTILCEVGSESRDEVTRILSAERYALFDMMARRSDRPRLEQAVWNTLAIPEERV